jgi:transcriptional regulator with XRE-family HTH domain
MARPKEHTFGQLIRERRRQLDLTQRQVAHRIRTSTPYLGYLESGKRHPSDQVLGRLAEVLGLEPRELFFLGNPGALEFVRPKEKVAKQSAWEQFSKDARFRRLHNVSDEEVAMLSRVALMGEITSPRDFFYILNTVRYALGR